MREMDKKSDEDFHRYGTETEKLQPGLKIFYIFSIHHISVMSDMISIISIIYHQYISIGLIYR